MAAPNVAGAVTPEFRVWSPQKRKKGKNRNSGFGPLKTGKGGKSGKNGKPEFWIWTLEPGRGVCVCVCKKTQEKERKMNSGVRYGIFGCNRNELRNKVRNCWHEGTETTENGKRNLKKGLCSRDTFAAATFGGLGYSQIYTTAAHSDTNSLQKQLPQNYSQFWIDLGPSRSE